MYRIFLTFICGLIFFLFCGTSFAHFGMLIPSSSTVTEQKQAALSLSLSFSHPMEMEGMSLEKPKSFQVFVSEKNEDLKPLLKPVKILDHDAWSAQYTIKAPGVYQFVMEPIPYWEPAEDCFIIHYTKTYVAAFGEEEGWTEPLGLKTEIVPLSRPFGNYAGNLFQGRVLLDGKPVPGAPVEVEFYNKDKRYAAPNEYLVTQVVTADANGVFSYSVPFAGWWGFAALNTADEKIKHENTPKDVELGAVFWVEFVNPRTVK
jgi:cobalt/nickel transport protein